MNRERDVQAWLDTVAAGESGATVRTTATPTIVPRDKRGESVRRATEFLAQLRTRRQGVELVVGAHRRRQFAVSAGNLGLATTLLWRWSKAAQSIATPPGATSPRA